MAPTPPLSDVGSVFEIGDEGSDAWTEPISTCSEELDREVMRSNSQMVVDHDDDTLLFNGNIHPPDYYRLGIREPVKRDRYARYAPKTRLRLLEVEDLWRQ